MDSWDTVNKNVILCMHPSPSSNKDYQLSRWDQDILTLCTSPSSPCSECHDRCFIINPPPKSLTCSGCLFLCITWTMSNFKLLTWWRFGKRCTESTAHPCPHAIIWENTMWFENSYTITQRSTRIQVRKSCFANITYIPALHFTVSLTHGFKGVLVPRKFGSLGQSLPAL